MAAQGRGATRATASRVMSPPEDPRSGVRPDSLRSPREDPPKLLLDEVRDGGALGKAVVGRYGAEHLDLPDGDGEAPEELSPTPFASTPHPNGHGPDLPTSTILYRNYI